MGKLEKNSKVLTENSYGFLNDEQISKVICEIDYSDYNSKSKGKTIKQYETYYANNHDDNSVLKQSGKVWVLVLQNEKTIEKVIQVAQALDKSRYSGFFNEIQSHIDEIFSNADGLYKKYADQMTKGDKLVFYEIILDKYISEFDKANNDVSFNCKEVIYDIAKEYMVEALIAHFTQAEEWGYWNCGMDKRAYYRVLNEIKEYAKNGEINRDCTVANTASNDEEHCNKRFDNGKL